MMLYLRTILITMTLCQLVLLVVEELGGDRTKRMLHFFCGLLLLTTLFSPLRTALDSFTELYNDLCALFSTAEVDTIHPDTAATESTMAYIAESWIEYIVAHYNLDRADITVTMETENHTITRAEITLYNCYYATRQQIEAAFQEKTDIPITVKGG